MRGGRRGGGAGSAGRLCGRHAAAVDVPLVLGSARCAEPRADRDLYGCRDLPDRTLERRTPGRTRSAAVPLPAPRRGAARAAARPSPWRAAAGAVRRRVHRQRQPASAGGICRARTPPWRLAGDRRYPGLRRVRSQHVTGGAVRARRRWLAAMAFHRRRPCCRRLLAGQGIRRASGAARRQRCASAALRARERQPRAHESAVDGRDPRRTTCAGRQPAGR